MIAKNLNVTFAGAIEYTLHSRLFSFATISAFFGSQIEASPGSRLTRKDEWAANLECCRSHHLRRRISPDNFATMAHLICHLKEIAVRQ
jgi:hypothetical protein